MKNILAITSICLFLYGGIALGQSHPSCQSIAQDFDNDGFGWIFSPSDPEQQPHTCIVTAETPQAPEIINRETNTPVQLTRAYWDGNRDLAGRTLACEEYLWRDDKYIKVHSYNRYHHPLPEEKPWINAWIKSDIQSFNGLPLIDRDIQFWTVVDGALDDGVGIRNPGFSLDKYWVEMISVGGGFENAVRWWTDSNPDADYVQCIDPETNVFVPTGSPDVAPTTVSNVFSTESVEFTTKVAQNQPEAGHSGAVLSRGAVWDIKDLAYLTIDCPSYSKPFGPDGIWVHSDTGGFTMMYLPGPASDPGSGFVMVENSHDTPVARGRKWQINDDGSIDVGDFPPLGARDWFELLSTGAEERDTLLFWLAPTVYTSCRLRSTQLDTPYTVRSSTQSDENAFINKNSFDTSHCSSAEEATLVFNGLNSCIAPDIASDSGSENDSSSVIAETIESDGVTEITTDAEEEQQPAIATDPIATSTVGGNAGGGSFSFSVFVFLAFLQGIRRKNNQGLGAFCKVQIRARALYEMGADTL